MKRPNIIIFNPDEMRADSLGHLGNPAAVTPFLDHFAAEEAVSFRNAFCQSPVCVPSRCSFTTGLYPHVHGHRTMEYLLREGESSLFSELKESGYYVWMNARNDLVAGQIQGLLDWHASEIYYGGRCRPAPGPVDSRKVSVKKFRNAFFEGRLALDDNGKNYNSDDEDVDAAIQRIRTKPDQPLCLFLGLTYPHPPYMAEEPYYSAARRDRIPARIRPQECSDKPPIEAAICRNQGIDSSVADAGEGFSEADWTELRAVYLGMCAKVDAQFHRLCEALREAGEYDNSAIFFLSDHGDYTGDYGIAEKNQNTFEDCLVRVPLLIKPPAGIDVDPGITDSLAELVDFYKTVMDIAGVPPTHTQFGRNLTPILADRSAQIRSFATCEGGRNPDEVHCDEFHARGPKGTSPSSPYYPRQLAQTDPKLHTLGYMFRTSDYKLVTRVDDTAELYDLNKDPQEKHNVADSPNYSEIRRRLEHQQMLWLMRTASVVPFDADRRFSEEMVWAKISAIVPKEFEEEYRAKIRNGMNPFMLRMECVRRFGNNERKE